MNQEIKKLRIALGSDIHCEFGPITLNNEENADVLVLAGDICVAAHFKEAGPTYTKHLAKEYRTFFDHVCKEFPHVVYILGNHEFYNGDIKHSYNILKEHLDYPNLHILEKETWTHQGHTFVGGTLWTDMNRSDPLTLMHTQGSMNDFREVLNSNRMVVRNVPVYERNPLWTDDGQNGGQYSRDATGAMIRIGYKSKEESARWTPEDSVEDHKKMLDYIDHVTCNPGSYIVVVHHAPSSLSIAERFKADTLMNGAFRSELDDFIESRPQIRLVCHGHMHNNSNYWIGSTRVVCNPRGYVGHESIANFFQLQYIDLA
jgi:Icc-related predicted phosphoesterase